MSKSFENFISEINNNRELRWILIFNYEIYVVQFPSLTIEIYSYVSAYGYEIYLLQTKNSTEP